MMSSLSRDQYEIVYTLRNEFGKDWKDNKDKKEDCPRRGQWTPRMWMWNPTPAERDVFLKYRQRGQRRTAVGGVLSASAMAGVWKLAAWRTGFGVAGMVVGGMIGAGLSMRTSGIRQEMAREMIMLPKDQSPRAAKAREILRTKLPENSIVQELMRSPALAD